MLTTGGALDKFKIDLATRGANSYSADWPRIHLTPALLGKPVSLLVADELKRWRDGLIGTIAPSTVNRIT